MQPAKSNTDNDLGKGAVEDDRTSAESHNSMSSQLEHRSEDTMIKQNDSDFPEPGSSPEHTGELGQTPDPKQPIGDPVDPESNTPVKAPGRPDPQQPDSDTDRDGGEDPGRGGGGRNSVE